MTEQEKKILLAVAAYFIFILTLVTIFFSEVVYK
jgi:hypothetical protein